MPKIIHILLSVIDNLGDMGFACELVRSFHEGFTGEHRFIVWTDNFEKTESFFEKNKTDIGSYEIRNKDKFTMNEEEILILLFHHPLPKVLPEGDILILRIDYLSFAREWVAHHGKEHIESRESRRIIEIIPSPLPGSGGLIAPPERLLERERLAKEFGLNPEKGWVSIFAYGETLKNHFTQEPFLDTEVIFLGDSKKTPFLSLLELASIIRESKWAVVRGEVSFISTLQIGTPLMWDMYKEIGGFHDGQADDFLEWIGADEEYRNLFERLNSRKKGGVKLSELDVYFSRHEWKGAGKQKSLVEEIKKYIDTFYNSL